MTSQYYLLDSAHTDPKRLKKEREKARALKKSQWWLSLVNQGICHYCQGKFSPSDLTMDHLIPLARGGRSVAGNLVPACSPCNQTKKLDTPVDQLFAELEKERRGGK